MKQNLLLAAVIIFFLACNNSEQTKDNNVASIQANEANAMVDTATARQELISMADDIHSRFKNKDISFVDKYMSKEGIYLGTDPNEVMPFNQFKDIVGMMLKDTTTKFGDYNITRREVKINGLSAVIIDQFMFPEINNKVMVRVIGYAKYQDGKWMFEMYSWNVIPKNEDLRKIDRVL